MQNSNINVYEELLKQSLLIPELVNKSTKRDNIFIDELNQWLLNTESKMKKNNISKCSEIAGLRSKIVSANYSISDSKVSRRKQKISIATSIIYDAQRTLLDVLEPIEKRLEEAKENIRQLLGVAYQADMIDPNMEFNLIIQTLWKTFATHDQLKAIIAKILVLVNKSDALRLLAQEIDISIVKEMGTSK